MVILAVGLLGLVGLQARLHVLQMESYQRAQALILLTDMANRMALNRINAGSYVSASTAGLGVGAACPVANTSRTERDLREWCLALQGAAETSGGNNVGVMVGGRGCIEQPDRERRRIPDHGRLAGPRAGVGPSRQRGLRGDTL